MILVRIYILISAALVPMNWMAGSEVRAIIPLADLALIHSQIPKESIPIDSGTVSVDVKQCGLDHAEALWWAPSTKTSRSDTVVIYLPYPNENLKNGGMAGKKLAAAYGFTVLSLPFVSENGRQDFNYLDHEKSYVWKSSGYSTALIACWEELVKMRSLPSRPFLCAGFSGGGLMVQHMMEWYPSNCDAGFSYGGHTFFHGNKSKSPGFFMHVFTDAGAAEVPPVLSYMRENSARAFCGTGYGEYDTSRGIPGSLFHHHPRLPDQAIVSDWIADISDLRSKGKEQLASTWPYAVTVPGGNVFGDAQLGSDPDHWPPKACATSFPDWKDKLAKSVGTPENKISLMFFPGKGSTSDWLDLVPQPFSFQLPAPTPSGKPNTVWWCPPPALRTPVALCWRVLGSNYKSGPDESPEVETWNDLRFMSDLGLIGITASPLTAAQRGAIKQKLFAINATWRSLPELTIFLQAEKGEVKSIFPTKANPTGVVWCGGSPKATLVSPGAKFTSFFLYSSAVDDAVEAGLKSQVTSFTPWSKSLSHTRALALKSCVESLKSQISKTDVNQPDIKKAK